MIPLLVASVLALASAAPPAGLAEVEAAVRAELAAQWGVDGGLVAVAWGTVPDVDLDAEAGVQLLGSGAGGVYVARVRARGGALLGLRLRAGVRGPAPVAARPLGRGEVLSAGDIAYRDTVRWGPPRTASAREVEEGWVVQRALRTGDALLEPAVRPPLAVVSGAPVRLVWVRGGVALSTAGRAAASGVVGDTVFVRAGSGRRLRGVVVAPGTVDVSKGGAS